MANLRAINVTPHVTQNDSITSTGKRRQSAIDGRTTQHEGYGLSQSRRAMTECIFGWGKQARHDAQDQTSRHSQCRCRFHAQSDRLQSNPHSQTAGGVARVRSQREKLLPASEHTLTAQPSDPAKDGKCATFRFFSKLLDCVAIPLLLGRNVRQGS